MARAGTAGEMLPPLRSPAAARSQSAEPPMWGVNSRGDSLFLYQQFSEHPMHDYAGDWNSRVSRDMKRNVLKEFRGEVRDLIDVASKSPKKPQKKERAKSPPDRVLFEREEAFHNRLEPKYQFPPYNALKDKHCPYVRSNKFRKRYDKYLEIAEAERPAMKRLTAAGGDASQWNISLDRPKTKKGGPSMKELMGLATEDDDEANKPKRLGAALKAAKAEREFAEKEAGEGIQDRPKRSKLACELEAYKCIVLREGYVQRLKEIFMAFAKGKGRNTSMTTEVANLFFSLRLAGLGCVEAISEWRESGEPSKTQDGGPSQETIGREATEDGQEQQQQHRPFLWNGQNYLIKMQSDLDFVDEIPEIGAWLGFSAMNNPFLIPADGDDTESGDDFVRHLFYNKEGIVVFNKTAANPLQSFSAQQRLATGGVNANASFAKTEGSKASLGGKTNRSKTPTSGKKSPGSVQGSTAALSSPGLSGPVLVKPKASSHINLMRVRNAEKIVLDEKPPSEEREPESDNEGGEVTDGDNVSRTGSVTKAQPPNADEINDAMSMLDLEGTF